MTIDFCVEILLLCVTPNCISISSLAIHIRLPLVLTFVPRFVQNNRATNTTNQPELHVTRSEPFFRGLQASLVNLLKLLIGSFGC